MRRLHLSTRLAGAGVVPLLMAGILSAGATADAGPARAGSMARTGFTITGQLHGVAALSASNAWAVGETGSEKPLMTHWNGTSWKQATILDPRFYLLGVAATSASNAWAAGYYCASRCASGPEVDHTVIVHWNGTTWKHVTSPSPSSTWNTLFGVAADSASDAWAVGWYCASRCASGPEVDHTLITHWNGTAWK